MAYDPRKIKEATNALFAWARSQELEPADVLYCTMRLIATQFIYNAADQRQSFDEMNKQLDGLGSTMPKLLKAMTMEVTKEIAKEVLDRGL